MIRHKLIEGGIDYPVGYNLNHNMPIIAQMGEKLAFVINKYYKDYYSIILVGRGSSGAMISAMIAPTVVRLTDKKIHIEYINKPDEDSHFKMSSLWDYKNSRDVLVIVDDFIKTGYTICAILDELKISRSIEKVDILCVTGPAKAMFDKKFTRAVCSK